MNQGDNDQHSIGHIKSNISILRAINLHINLDHFDLQNILLSILVRRTHILPYYTYQRHHLDKRKDSIWLFITVKNQNTPDIIRYFIILEFH